MALSTAERQRRYRERAKASTARVSFSISIDAATALDALASQTGTTKRNALEAAILSARPEPALPRNPEHQRLFSIPTPAPSTERALVSAPLPDPEAITGDRELDAVLWLGHVIKTAVEPAVLDRAAEAASQITTPAKEIEQRYADWLQRQPGAHPFQIAFAVVGAGDLEKQIERARERISVYREGLALFGSHEAAMMPTPAEQMILDTIAPLPDGEHWNWTPDELARLFARSINPASLTEVVNELRYWSWLGHLRWKMAETHGDYSDDSAEIDARRWWAESLLTTMLPQTRTEAGAVVDAIKAGLIDIGSTDDGQRRAGVYEHLLGWLLI
jgi:hypothetical protein